MQVFQVRQGASGAILWTGEAAGEAQALDAMAHEAGYSGETDLPEAIRRRGLSVETLNFADRAVPQGRVQGGRGGSVAAQGGTAGLSRGVHRSARAG